MNSILAVKAEVLFTSLNGWSPKRSTFEILELSLLKIFSSILWSLLKSVCFIWKTGKAKKVMNSYFNSTASAKGLNVSWKLCLNLWNRRWLNSSLIILIKFKHLGLWRWKVLFVEGLMKSWWWKPICVSWKAPVSHSFLYWNLSFFIE